MELVENVPIEGDIKRIDIPVGYDIPGVSFREVKDGIVIQVNDKEIPVHSPNQQDVTKNWKTQEVDKQIWLKDPHASRLYDIYAGTVYKRRPDISEEELQTECRKYFDYLESIGAKEKWYGVNVGNMTIHYDTVSPYPITEIQGFPPGLISFIQSLEHVSNFLDIEIPESKIFVIDLYDFERQEGGYSFSGEEPMDNWDSKFQKDTGCLGMFSGDTLIVTHHATSKKEAATGDIIMTSEMSTQSNEKERHEITHMLDKAVTLVNKLDENGVSRPHPALEGLAVMTQYNGDPAKCLGDYIEDIHGKFEWSRIVDTFRNPGQASRDDVYLVSGSLYSTIREVYGAQAVKKFHALITGNYGNPLAKFAPNCKGDLEKTLEEIALTYDDNKDISKIKDTLTSRVKAVEDRHFN